MKTVQYLDAVKAALNISSDYALSKALGVTRGAVSGYRNGHSTFDHLIAARVASLLGVPELQVISDVEIERAARSAMPEHSKLWKRIRDAAVLALVTIGAGLLGAPPADARTSHNQNVSFNGPEYTLCNYLSAHCSIFLRWLAALLFGAALAGCAVEPARFTIPESAPLAVAVTWERVTPEWLRILCPQYADRPTNACAAFNASRPVSCTIYTTAEVDERLIGHELLHCYLGAFHSVR